MELLVGRRRVVAAVLMALLLSVGLVASGCGRAGADPTISIGVSFDRPGLGERSGESYSGFDIDVATYVAGRLGYSPDRIRWVEAPVAARENLLRGGQVSLVVAAYTITPERTQLVNLAGPYFQTGQGVLVPADSAVRRVEDLAGRRVCAVTGSLPATRLTGAVPEAQVVLTDTDGRCLDALASGKVDAMTTDDVIAAGLAAEGRFPSRLRLIQTTLGTDRYGIGVPLDDVALCRRVTQAVNQMISSGEWSRSAARHLTGWPGYSVPPAPPRENC